jgi:hypothetical protein
LPKSTDQISLLRLSRTSTSAPFASLISQYHIKLIKKCNICYLHYKITPLQLTFQNNWENTFSARVVETLYNVLMVNEKLLLGNTIVLKLYEIPMAAHPNTEAWENTLRCARLPLSSARPHGNGHDTCRLSWLVERFFLSPDNSRSTIIWSLVLGVKGSQVLRMNAHVVKKLSRYLLQPRGPV